MLAADDNATNRQVLASILPAMGMEAVLVEDGLQVAAALATGALATGAFDLVLCDLHMPGCDGLEVARRRRAAEGPDHRLPLILLSGDMSDAVRSEGLAGGFDDFVAKPFGGRDAA